MDGPASLVTSMIGLQIAPHFNKPFIAESLTSFWGKRWNLTISNCLRGPVYDPIYEGDMSSDHRAVDLCGTLAPTGITELLGMNMENWEACDLHLKFSSRYC